MPGLPRGGKRPRGIFGERETGGEGGVHGKDSEGGGLLVFPKVPQLRKARCSPACPAAQRGGKKKQAKAIRAGGRQSDNHLREEKRANGGVGTMIS